MGPKRNAQLVIVSFATVATIAACRGAAETDLFDRPVVEQAPAEPEPAPEADDPAEPPGDDAGTVKVEAGSADAATGPIVAKDAGAAYDAGTPDAGPVWKSPGVFCGTGPNGKRSYCATGTQLCCATLDERIEFQFACVAASPNACSGGKPLRCDDRSDCLAGQVCCATFQQGAGYRSSRCQSSCTGASSVRLCDLGAPIDECTAAGKTCTPSQNLDGFGYCD